MVSIRKAAANTFEKGLIMDFNPTIARNNCLVNALNATLLTFNGNEMQLQQDMGNGRVETAYLPEGYVPVGACEFGDIIYIVSYNPLEDKSQIGCFPSPERNITSDESVDLEQELSINDFQELTDGSPNGNLKTMSVKKIVYGNKNMNPGDKYIIYTEGSGDSDPITKNEVTLTDFGSKAHSHNSWPKFVKLKVVSIEDSGKIVDLNASVKWYDNDYYLPALQSNAASQKIDIDSYRSLVSSAYSIFQSKVSGKLAILAELETIDSFSCTYEVFTSKGTDAKTSGDTINYAVYFYTSWETSHNDVNPVGFAITESTWNSKNTDNNGKVGIPKTREDGVSEYEYVEELEVPVSANPNTLFTYSRTYELENPGDDYVNYRDNLSYNCQIANILNWKYDKNTGKYEAIGTLNSNTTINDFRPVTKLSRLLNTTTGEPTGKYLYNLYKYKKGSDGTYAYMTALLNGKEHSITPISLNDDVVVNSFHKDVVTCMTELPKDGESKNSFSLVNSVNGIKTDLSNMIWSYKITPAMPYGRLDHLSINGEIDFSKIGTGTIDLTTWKYYVYGDLMTLSWGLDVYPEPNKGVAEVTFDFFDNQGLAASVHNIGKSSFSGTFTDQIILNKNFASYNVDNISAEGSEYIHAGEAMDEEANQDDSEVKVYLKHSSCSTPNAPTTDIRTNGRINYGPYHNDASTIHSNCLYLVKITVKYCSKDIVGEYNTDNTGEFAYFYRWCWTNGMFNDNYYSTKDFSVLQPQLSLGFSATFNTNGAGSTNVLEPDINSEYYNRSVADLSENTLYKTIGARVFSINQNFEDDETGNIQMLLTPGLENGYNVFNLNSSSSSLDNLKVRISLGKSSITKSVEEPSTLYTGSNINIPEAAYIQPVVAPVLDSYVKVNYTANPDYSPLKGKEVSGYAGCCYGRNNSQISTDIFGEDVFKGVATDGYYGDMETATNNSNIYDSKSSYKGFVDSFSVNFAGTYSNGDFKLLNASNTGTSALQYLDEEGEDQSVDIYPVKTMTIKDLTDPQKGVALSLAGTAYQKIVAAQYTTNISIHKTARSLYNIASNISNNLGYVITSGTTTPNYHFFKNIVCFDRKDDGGRKAWFKAWTVDSPTWYQSSNVDLYENTSGDCVVKYTDPAMADGLKYCWSKLDSDVFVAALLLGRSFEDNYFHVIRTINDEEVGQFKFRGTFTDKYASGYKDCDIDGKGECGKTFHLKGGTPSDWIYGDHASRFSHMPLWKSLSDDIPYPTSDLFCISSTSGRQRSDESNDFTKQPFITTMADMVASVLLQLYVINSNVDSSLAVTYTNVAYLNAYSEYWNKDVIIEIEDMSSLEDPAKLLLINTQSYENYLRYLFTNSGISGELKTTLSKDKNVTITLDAKRQTYKLRYEIPYNVQYLLSKYTNSAKNTEGVTVYLGAYGDSIGYESTVDVSGSYSSGVLYTYNGTQQLEELTNSSNLRYAAKFAGDNYSSRHISKFVSGERVTGDLSLLTKYLKYDEIENKLYFDSLSSYFSSSPSTYRLGTWGNGDSYIEMAHRVLFNAYPVQI